MRSDPPREVIAEAIANERNGVSGFGWMSEDGRWADAVLRALRTHGYAIIPVSGDSYAVVDEETFDRISAMEP